MINILNNKQLICSKCLYIFPLDSDINLLQKCPNCNNNGTVKTIEDLVLDGEKSKKISNGENNE